MHNVYSAELQRYFSFSQNIVAINCIETDIQDRANRKVIALHEYFPLSQSADIKLQYFGLLVPEPFAVSE